MKKYSKELLDSVENNRYDEELFLVIAKEIIDDLDLNNYVKNISLSNLFQKNVGGTYDGSNIEINTKKKEISMLYYYRALFDTLFHELEHVKQHKLMDLYDGYVKKLPSDYVVTDDMLDMLTSIHLIGTSYKIIEKNEKMYMRNHDMFPTEREANFYGFINSSNFLADMLPEYKNHLIHPNIYNYRLMRILLNGYKIKLLNGKLVSPFERVLTKEIEPIIKEFLLENKFLNNYEKIIIGLPIEKDLFLQLYNETINGIIPLDIKKRILK